MNARTVALASVAVVAVVLAALGSWHWASATGPDVNNDGAVSVQDIIQVVQSFGQMVPTPTPPATNTPTPTVTPTAIPGLEDIEVTMDATLDTVRNGLPLTYTIMARNIGDATGDVEVVFTPGPGFQFQGTTLTIGDSVPSNCVTGGPTFVCGRNGLAPGKFITMVATGVYTTATNTSVTVQAIDLSPNDGNPANNSVAVTTHVIVP